MTIFSILSGNASTFERNSLKKEKMDSSECNCQKEYFTCRSPLGLMEHKKFLYIEAAASNGGNSKDSVIHVLEINHYELPL